MKIIDRSDWVPCQFLKPDQVTRLFLFNDEVVSAQIAYRDFSEADGRVRTAIAAGCRPPSGRETFHYAKVFVGTVRQVGRLAESLVKHRSDFGNECGKAFQIAWRKHKSVFDTFVDPRNAIEHIDNEVVGNRHFFCLHGDRLMVTDEIGARITYSVVESAMELRDEMLKAVVQHFPAQRSSTTRV